jgi:hypothetical protein
MFIYCWCTFNDIQRKEIPHTLCARSTTFVRAVCAPHCIISVGKKKNEGGVLRWVRVVYTLARPSLLLHPPSRAKNVKSLHNLMMMETLQKQQQTLGPLIAPVACANLINSRRQYQFQDQRTRQNYGSQRGEMSSQKGVFID